MPSVCSAFGAFILCCLHQGELSRKPDSKLPHQGHMEFTGFHFKRSSNNSPGIFNTTLIHTVFVSRTIFKSTHLKDSNGIVLPLASLSLEGKKSNHTNQKQYYYLTFIPEHSALREYINFLLPPNEEKSCWKVVTAPLNKTFYTRQNTPPQFAPR